MSWRLFLAFAAVPTVLVAAGFQGYHPKAPAFDGTTADGKTVSLKSLTAEKPVILYFIKKDCPVNEKAEKYFNRIYSATGNGNLVGIFNGDKTEFFAWQKQFKAPFTIILDPKSDVIHKFGAQRSPWVVQVSSDGRMANEWHGYSAAIVREVANVLKPGAKIDLTGAPAEPTYG